ncbi:hypothetical protein KVMX100_10085 [Klebsiella variicola]|nr:hypothetical protein KVMX100_10085 [Klebsiella variicola]
MSIIKDGDSIYITLPRMINLVKTIVHEVNHETAPAAKRHRLAGSVSAGHHRQFCL